MTSTFLIIKELVQPLVRNVTDWLCVTVIDCLLNHRLALFNSNTLLMLWWLMKGCMGQRFRHSVVWIAELVHVKKVGNWFK